jgi:hypothetical protein
MTRDISCGAMSATFLWNLKLSSEQPLVLRDCARFGGVFAQGQIKVHCLIKGNRRSLPLAEGEFGEKALRLGARVGKRDGWIAAD